MAVIRDRHSRGSDHPGIDVAAPHLSPSAHFDTELSAVSVLLGGREMPPCTFSLTLPGQCS